MTDQEVWKAKGKCHEQGSHRSGAIWSIVKFNCRKHHFMVSYWQQVENNGCIKGKGRGSEGWCQEAEAFKILNDTKDMDTNHLEKVPARVPYRHKISQCKSFSEN